MASDFGSPRELSALQKRRTLYLPQLPPCIQGSAVRVEFGERTTAADASGAEAAAKAFPRTFGQPVAHFVRSEKASARDAQVIADHPPARVGVVFSGRQCPGGHNVVWGLYDAMKAHNPTSTVLGFLGGTQGLLEKKTLEITDGLLSSYKNQGGFDMLGRSADKMDTDAAMSACHDLNLDGLVVVGGAKSNSDAAHLAEAFAEQNCKTKVVGVPVTLNGDLKNQFIETTVGFDTICKVSSQLISNVCLDALSAGKYYHFIRVMGGKASHVALECALQSNPNMLILGEEVALSKLTLREITRRLCDAVQARAAKEMYHGVVLIPEGLIQSIPEMNVLLQEIHALQRQGVAKEDVPSLLAPWTSALFQFLPSFLKEELLLPQESDGSAQLTQINSEELIAQLVEGEMNKRMKEGVYKGKKFSRVCHFFGYQARGSLPSKFDCDYAYVLGHVCSHILAAGLNGYMATVTNLKNPISKWRCGAAPLTAMMSVQRRSHGPGAIPVGKPAINTSIIELKGKAYRLFRDNAEALLVEDRYKAPGTLQFDGPGEDLKSFTLSAEDQDYMGQLKILHEHLEKIRRITKPGCSRDILQATVSSTASLLDVLSVMSTPRTFESSSPI